MAIDIRTNLSRYGHALTADRTRSRLTNLRLAAARELVSPLNLQGVSLLLQQIHFGPERYRRGAAVGAHQHRELQIEYVVTGKVSFTGPRGSTELAAGQGALIAPNTLHSWESVETAAMLGVQLQIVGRERDPLITFLRESVRGELPRFDTPKLNRLSVQLFQELSEGALWQRERSANWILLWLSAVLSDRLDLRTWRQPDAAVHRTAAHGEELCARAQAFIQANYAQPLQLADIALQAGVSPRHLNRLFQKHRQTTVTAALQATRLQQARKRLEGDPDVAVKTVAYECGFRQHAYFSSCFKKAFGKSPNEVR